MGTTTFSLADVQRIVSGAVDKAAELGIAVSVAVLDANGHIRQITRMDGAGWFTPRIASGKAYAAAAFRRDSGELAERFGASPLFAGAFADLSDGQMAIGPGAVVLRAGDEILGAVGVSGGRPDQDVLCAQAGCARWVDPAAGGSA